MKRSFAAIAIALLAIAVVIALWRWRTARGPEDLSASPERVEKGTDGAALALLQGIPFYRATLTGRALRRASLDNDGTLRVEVDLGAAVEPRLAALGFTGASSLLPVVARGTIAPTAGRESWIFEGPAPLFALLDRNPAAKGATVALDAIPGAPSALVRARLLPSSLNDPTLGGAPLAVWRDRVGFAEKLLGRPVRAELAEDLAGPAVFALYETEDPAAAEAIVAVELRRSDRIAGLLDMMFGLGALAERATVRRYRGVATGSFVSGSGGPDLALAVDGPLLFVASSRGLLESAIDAKRAGAHRGGIRVDEEGASASWSAVSSSTFVAHGWARLARLPGARSAEAATTTAALWPEGSASWRLTGRGASPAITADPVLPFLRSALTKRQGVSD